MRMLFFVLVFGLAPMASRACETALVLSIDVSNSIDAGEYRLQTDGLANALLDPEIGEILVRDQVALTVVQWSGEDKQEQSIEWRRMRSPSDVAGFSQAARAMPRAFVLSNTAPAEAIAFSLDLLRDVAACKRKVIDVSGDGTANAGREVRRVVRRAERAGVTINGIAIEGLGVAITNYFRSSIVTQNGFVLTARGHRDYPRAIRAKILREISRLMG